MALEHVFVVMVSLYLCSECQALRMWHKGLLLGSRIQYSGGHKGLGSTRVVKAASTVQMLVTCCMDWPSGQAAPICMLKRLDYNCARNGHGCSWVFHSNTRSLWPCLCKGPFSALLLLAGCTFTRQFSRSVGKWSLAAASQWQQASHVGFRRYREVCSQLCFQHESRTWSVTLQLHSQVEAPCDGGNPAL